RTGRPCEPPWSLRPGRPGTPGGTLRTGECVPLRRSGYPVIPLRAHDGRLVGPGRQRPMRRAILDVAVLVFEQRRRPTVSHPRGRRRCAPGGGERHERGRGRLHAMSSHVNHPPKSLLAVAEPRRRASGGARDGNDHHFDAPVVLPALLGGLRAPQGHLAVGARADRLRRDARRDQRAADGLHATPGGPWIPSGPADPDGPATPCGPAGPKTFQPSGPPIGRTAQPPTTSAAAKNNVIRLMAASSL